MGNNPSKPKVGEDKDTASQAAKWLDKAQKALRAATSKKVAAIPSLQRLAYQEAIDCFEKFFSNSEIQNRSDLAKLNQKFEKAKKDLAKLDSAKDGEAKETPRTIESRGEETTSEPQKNLLPPSSGSAMNTGGSWVQSSNGSQEGIEHRSPPLPSPIPAQVNASLKLEEKQDSESEADHQGKNVLPLSSPARDNSSTARREGKTEDSPKTTKPEDEKDGAINNSKNVSSTSKQGDQKSSKPDVEGESIPLEGNPSRAVIFRKATPLPEDEPVDLNRPIDDTRYLARVLRELPKDSARREPLELLSHQVIEQFARRLVRRPEILQEVIALSSVPDAELLHKILQQFLNLFAKEAALDVELLEGLAILLESAHPDAMSAIKSARSTEREVETPEKEPLSKKIKEELPKAVPEALADIGVISDKAVPLIEDVGESAIKVVRNIREAFKSFLNKKGSTKPTAPTSTDTSVVETKGNATVTTSSTSDSKHTPSNTSPRELSPSGSANSDDNQINHLLSLLNTLIEKYLAFHRQAQTAVQEAELLRALARVLDAMRDIGVIGVSQDKTRKKVYDALAGTADDEEADPAVSLWANYAIQALIRLEDDSSILSEWVTRGKNLAKVITNLKEVWNKWDLTKLGEAYTAGKEAFKIDHQPESWYESLWYCQLLIHAGQFQALEEYLYQNKSDKAEPLCPDRCMPAFQLGLIAALDGVIRDPKWSGTVKSGCLQLLQSLFLNEIHWYVEPEKMPASTWREYFHEKTQQASQALKKRALYSGLAYQARQQAVQGAALEQLVSYLQDPVLYSEAQAVLSAIRHPSIKPPLTKEQLQLLEQHAPLAKILKVSQTGSTLTPTKPSQVLLIPAKEVVEKHLAWKLDRLRASVLASANQDHDALTYYVPPKGLRKNQDEEPAFDLLEASLHFLGLTPKNPADRKATAKPAAPLISSASSSITTTSAPTTEPSNVRADIQPAEGKVDDMEMVVQDGKHTIPSVSEPPSLSPLPKKEQKYEVDEQRRRVLDTNNREKYKASSVEASSSSAITADEQQQPINDSSPATSSAADLSRCTIDCRRVTGSIDPDFANQWRRAYSHDATRFLLVYCEEVVENRQKTLPTISSSVSAESNNSKTIGSWYFCGESGEGEYLEGTLENGHDWLKKENISSSAKQCLLGLLPLLTPKDATIPAEIVVLLQNPQAEVTQQIKRHLLSGLKHLAVVNRTPATPQPQQVLLLTGDAGSGKSTYGLYLQRFLWQHYRSGGYIPVFIPLVQQPRSGKTFIEEFFTQKGFNDDDIHQLKDRSKGYHFLFIFDGYDELPGLKGQNLFHNNKLHEWPDCRVIIGCRAELLTGSKYEKWFALCDDKDQPRRDTLLTRWVAPFNSMQTHNYLKKYVRQKREQQALSNETWDGWLDWRRYQDEIDKLSSIRELIERPFMLTILVDVLPAMQREHKDSLSLVSRLDLYEMFMQQHFKRAKRKITSEMIADAKRDGNKQYAFRFYEGEEIDVDYQEFCENLAAYLFKNNQLTALYQRQWQVKEQGATLASHKLDRFFKSSDPAVQLVLRGCPIIPQGTNRYGYWHKSIWEYFVACRIYHELSWSLVPWKKDPIIGINSPGEPKASAESKTSQKDAQIRKLHLVVSFACFKRRVMQPLMTRSTMVRLQESNPLNLLISQRFLNSEPSILQFLANCAARDNRFQRTLLYWVLASRTQPELEIASSNALTILNIARVPFSGMNLSGVHVCGADLSQALLDHTNLSNADLRKVNFVQAFLRGTQFNNSRLKGAFFESMVGQEVAGGHTIRNEVIVSPNKQAVFFIDRSQEEVRIYNTQSGEFLKPIQAPPNEKISDIVMAQFQDICLAFLYDLQDSCQVLVYDVCSKNLSEEPLKMLADEFVNEIVIASCQDSCLAFLYDRNGGKVFVYDVGSKQPSKKAEAIEIRGGETITKVVVAPYQEGCLAFLHDENSEKVFVYDVASKRLLKEPLEIPCYEKISEIVVASYQGGCLAFLCEFDDEFNRDGVFVYDVASKQSSKKAEAIEIPGGETITKVVVAPYQNNCLAFLYVEGEGGKKVFVYDVTSKQLLKDPVGTPPGERVVKIVVAPYQNGCLAFLYSAGDKIFVYDVVSKHLLKEPVKILAGEKLDNIAIASHQDSVLAFFYNPTGSRQVFVYDCRTRQPLTTCQFDESIYGVKLFKLSNNNSVCVFWAYYHCYIVDIADTTLQKPFSLSKKMTEKIKDIDLLANGDLWVQGQSRSYQVGNWQIPASTKTTLLEVATGHTAKIEKVEKLSDTLIVSTSDHKETHMWQVQGLKLVPLHSLEYQPTVKILDSDLAFLYNQEEGSSQQVLVYNVTSKQFLNPVRLSDDEVVGKVVTASYQGGCVTFLCTRRSSPNIAYIGIHRIFMYDVSSKKLLEKPLEIPASERVAEIVVASYQDSCLAFLYRRSGLTIGSHQVFVCDVAAKKLLKEPLEMPKGEIISKIVVAPYQGGCLAFLCSHRRKVLVYDASSKESLKKPAKELTGVKSSKITIATYQSGCLAFLYGSGDEVWVYNVASNQSLVAEPLKIPVREINDVVVASYQGGCLAFLYGSGNEVWVYDVVSKQLLEEPLEMPAGDGVEKVVVAPHQGGCLAFLANGHRLVLGYFCKQGKINILADLKNLNVNSVFNFQLAFLNKDSAPKKETKIEQNPAQPIDPEQPSLPGIVLYGKGGCYLWLTPSNKIITLLKGIEITTVTCFPGNSEQLGIKKQELPPLRLLTGGVDGTLRLWDISDLEKPLLKFCTPGLTFYAQGVQFNAQTQLSDDNRRILQKHSAGKIEEVVLDTDPVEAKESKSERKRERKDSDEHFNTVPAQQLHESEDQQLSAAPQSDPKKLSISSSPSSSGSSFFQPAPRTSQEVESKAEQKQQNAPLYLSRTPSPVVNASSTQEIEEGSFLGEQQPNDTLQEASREDRSAMLLKILIGGRG